MTILVIFLSKMFFLLMVDVGMVRCVNVPAIYMFGDSTADVGNNNQLLGNEVSRANFSPYGIDYPGGIAIGKFCNGKIEIDYIGMLLFLVLIVRAIFLNDLEFKLIPLK
ncbi:hypothetical protein ZOSMA_18G00480 [Zostera marina]|uniref:GDSL esterase/lipase n=1 Tax=Zostera marina TaxID=29655 RepID=A0A0K9PRV7_ZOSMR|nr:hypothetical protein ZOSMA_18G00480 [Zostera marina]